MSDLTVFEMAITQELLKAEPASPSADVSGITVRSREYSGVGFFTHIEPNASARLYQDGRTFKWSHLGAKLGTACIESGYVLYIKGGFLEMIEGFTYGEEWPTQLEPYSFYLL